MEEQILKIIQNNASGSTDSITDGLYHSLAAKELADTFKKFIRWMFEEEYFYGELSEKYFSTKTDNLDFKSIDDIFNYWNEHINKSHERRQDSCKE